MMESSNVNAVSTKTVIAKIDKVLGEEPFCSSTPAVDRHHCTEDDTKENIDKLSDPLLSYDEFFRNYLLQNRPCLIDPFLTEDWKSSQEWKALNGDGEVIPDLQAISKCVGDSPVPVSNCR